MIRFLLALWGAKLYMFLLKIKGIKSDRPGLLAMKICPEFLNKIHKPEFIVAVTGTNGKSTSSILIAHFLMKRGYKVSFNEGGANCMAGYALNFLRGVNIFNRLKVNCSVLEMDELSLDTMGQSIVPTYILVTNLMRDSILRNGHPENIWNHIHRAFILWGNKTKAILNADDPISCTLTEGTNSESFWFSMKNIETNPLHNRYYDITCCPKCGCDLCYDYRLYKHFGSYHCSQCDFKNPKAIFQALSCDFNKRSMKIKYLDEIDTYPLISDTLFNAYNVLGVVSVLRLLGYSQEAIADFLSSHMMPDMRETCIEYDGISYHNYCGKALNGSSVGTNFECIAKDNSDKEIVLLLDDVIDKNHPPETVTWLYETDYEFLNTPSVKKIIYGGRYYLLQKFRMLLAGIPEEKIVCLNSEEEIPQYVDCEGISKVDIIFDVEAIERGKRIRNLIIENAKMKKGQKEEKVKYENN